MPTRSCYKLFLQAYTRALNRNTNNYEYSNYTKQLLPIGAVQIYNINLSSESSTGEIGARSIKMRTFARMHQMHTRLPCQQPLPTGNTSWSTPEMF